MSTSYKKVTGNHGQYDLIVPFDNISMWLILGSSCHTRKLHKNTNASINVIDVNAFKAHICKTSGYPGRG